MKFFRLSFLLVLGVAWMEIFPTNGNFTIPEPVYAFTKRLQFIVQVFPKQTGTRPVINLIIPIEEKFNISVNIFKTIFNSSSVSLHTYYFSNKLTPKQEIGTFNIIMSNSVEHLL